MYQHIPPDPFEELRLWADRNRPDISKYLDMFNDQNVEHQAVLLLVGAAFDAGRWFERGPLAKLPLLGKNPRVSSEDSGR